MPAISCKTVFWFCRNHNSLFKYIFLFHIVIVDFYPTTLGQYALHSYYYFISMVVYSVSIATELCASGKISPGLISLDFSWIRWAAVLVNLYHYYGENVTPRCKWRQSQWKYCYYFGNILWGNMGSSHSWRSFLLCTDFSNIIENQVHHFMASFMPHKLYGNASRNMNKTSLCWLGLEFSQIAIT